MSGIQRFCSSSKEPPFQNDCEFQQQIEMWIQPNRHFPYVQLQHYKYIDLRDSAKLRKNSRPSYRCVVCNKSCSSVTLLKYHKIALHSDHELVRSDPFFAENVEKYKRHRQMTRNWKRKPDTLAEIFSCSKCPLTFTRKDHHDKHENSHGDTFRCELCPLGFKLGRGLALHMKCMHPDKRIQSSKVIEDTDGIRTQQSRKLHNLVKQYSCSKCPLIFKRKEHCDRHETIHGDTFRCEFCSVAFKQSNGLLSHKKLIHLDDEHYQSSEDIEETNGNISHEDLSMFPIQSTKSQKRRFAKSYLNRHLALSRRRRKDCIVCDKSFSRLILLRFHLVSHHSDHELVRSDPLFAHNVEMYKRHRQRRIRSFSCSKCSLMFKTKRHRNNHENIHGDTFRCAFCPLGFKKPRGLLLHMQQIHPVERNQSSDIVPIADFQCPQCARKLSRMDALTRHMKWHETGTTKYSCTKCTSLFRKKSQRDIHENSHGDGFICEFCSVGFKQAEGLILHKNLMHKDFRDLNGEDIVDRTSTNDITDTEIKMETVDNNVCSPSSAIKTEDTALSWGRGITNDFSAPTPQSDGTVSNILPTTATTANDLHCHKSKLRSDSDKRSSKQVKRKRFKKTVQSKSSSKTTKFSCSKCSLTFKKRYNRDMHENIHGDTFRCEFCSVGFKQACGLTLHKNLIHQDYRDLFCQDGISTNDNNDITFTDIKMEYVEAVDNNVCPPSNAIKTEAEDPVLSWDGSILNDPLAPITLGECSTSIIFPTTVLKRRLRNFSCSKCSLMFKDKHHRDKHEKIHGDTFRCEFCTVGFKRAYGLTSHIKRIHPDEQNQPSDIASIADLQCPQCAKKLSRLDALIRHMKWHKTGTTNTNYSCSKCTSLFRKKCQRDIHENSHGDAFVCEFCSVGFKQAEDLILHKNLVHKDYRDLYGEGVEDSTSTNDITFTDIKMEYVETVDNNVCPPSTGIKVEVEDPVLSWCRSISEDSSAPTLLGDCSAANIFPTTVLKME